MSWNIKTPGDYINGPLTVAGSATITGDLTVDTSTLKVDSANDRVGIGTATPGGALEVFKNTNGQNRLFLNNPSTGTGAYDAIDFTAGTANNQILSMGSGYSGSFPYLTGALLLRSAQANGIVLNTAGSAAAIQFGINNTLAMTLNATGLGIGTASPTQVLTVRGNVLTTAAAGTDSYANVSTDGVQNSYLGFNNSGSTNAAGASNNNTYIGNGNNYGTQIVGNSNILASFGTTGVFNWYDGAGGTRMTLNSTGLGVGASPSTRLHIQNTGDVYARIATTSVSKAGVQFSANGVVRSHLLYDDGAGTTYLTTGTSFGGSGQALAIQSGTSLSIYTNNQLATAQMTLDASGNLLVGTTSNNPAGTQSQFVNQWSGGSKWGSTFNQTVSSASYYTHIAFCTNGTVRGSIDANNAAITYGTVSDYRLKEAVQPLVGGLARISALKPSTYKWKESQSDGEGFIAHELASVVPLAVIGEKDAVNEDGSIKAQQVDLSKVVPVLVAAIQELTARVQTLETR